MKDNRVSNKKLLVIRIVNNVLSFILFYFSHFLLFGFILLFFILDLDKNII